MLTTIASTQIIKWFVLLPNFYAALLQLMIIQFKEGLAAARSDDVASLKGVVIDWITSPPYNASTCENPLARNIKTTRGFHNPVIGQLLCPTDLDWTDPMYVPCPFFTHSFSYIHRTLSIQAGLRDGTLIPDASQWPNFFYANGCVENPDDVFEGLFRHALLIKVTFVSTHTPVCYPILILAPDCQTYIHIT